MFNKRGNVGAEAPRILALEIIPAVFILIIMVAIVGTLLVLYFSNDPECDNYLQWEIVEEALEKIDKASDGQVGIQFYNEGCYLTGFSDPITNQDNAIIRGKNVGPNTQLCLCNLDEIRCNAYNCKELKYINLIQDKNEEQFTSIGLQEYAGVEFIKQGKTLTLLSAEQAKYIDFTYTNNPKYNLLDQGMIKDMSLKVRGEGIEGAITVLPVVTLKDTPTLPPQGIPSQSYFFDIDIRKVSVSMEDITIQQFLLNAKTVDPSDIKESKLTINLLKTALTEKQIYGPLKINYLKGNKWNTKEMECYTVTQDTAEVYQCTFTLDGFAKEFAIS